MADPLAVIHPVSMVHGEESVVLPAFREMLKGFGGARLQHHDDAVYGLLPEMTLGFLNPAWFRFARENGGREIPERWGLGACVLAATSGPARDLYEAGFRRCLEHDRPWRQDYECSTAARYRRFHMDVYPLEAGRGLLVVNTVFVDRPHTDDRVARPPAHERYTGTDGLVLQCSFCRRVQRADGSRRWDWIPAWIQDPPPNATGGLCEPCLDVHFPPVRPRP